MSYEERQSQKESVDKIAEHIHKALMSMDDFSRNVHFPRAMRKYLREYEYSDDKGGMSNPLLKSLSDEYVNSYSEEIMSMVDYIWENQEEDDDSYGDIDWTVVKVLDRGEGKDQKRVLTIEDNCGSSGIYMILQEGKKFNFGQIESDLATHIRKIVPEESCEYIRGDRYPHKKSLKFYEDRGWTCNYVEKLHMTPLGGCYGDIRDDGYVLSINNDMSPDRDIHYY